MSPRGQPGDRRERRSEIRNSQRSSVGSEGYGVPEVGAALMFPGWLEGVTRWDTGQVVLESLLVVWARLVSRPSSPRADLLRLRSQKLTVGWLRAFCRSPTFWPSSVVTLPTLRHCEGSRGAVWGVQGRVL